MLSTLFCVRDVVFNMLVRQVSCFDDSTIIGLILKVRATAYLIYLYLVLYSVEGKPRGTLSGSEGHSVHGGKVTDTQWI